MSLEVSVFIIAIAFSALVVFLIILLRSVWLAVDEFRVTLKRLDPFIGSVSTIGKMAEESLNQKKRELSEKGKASRIEMAIEWVTAGLNLWLQMKKKDGR